MGSMFCYAAAALMIAAAAFLYMRIPAGWLCDFDEEACEMHFPGIRGRGHRPAVMFTAGLAAMVCMSRGLASVLTDCRESGQGLLLCLQCLWICAAFVMLAAAGMADVEYMIIPDLLAAGTAGCGLVFHSVLSALVPGPGETVSESLVRGLGYAVTGGLTGGGLMLAAGLLAGMICGSGSMGFGDIKLMAACGALAGGSEKPVMIFIMVHIMSGCFMMAGRVSGRLDRGAFVALAPFIAVATYLCI